MTCLKLGIVAKAEGTLVGEESCSVFVRVLNDYLTTLECYELLLFLSYYLFIIYFLFI